MKTVRGDLISLAKKGEFDVIIHGCNCFCTMGAGIALQVRECFPQAYEEDLKTKRGDKNKLGDISYTEVEVKGVKLIVVNAYTQYSYRGRGQKADYKAIRSVFKKIKEKYTGLRIAYPAIGAGLAGGNWEVISKIINEELADENHTFVIYNK